MRHFQRLRADLRAPQIYRCDADQRSVIFGITRGGRAREEFESRGHLVHVQRVQHLFRAWPREFDQAGGRVDRQRSAHHQHLVGRGHVLARLVHVLGLFAEPHDVGPQLRAFLALSARARWVRRRCGTACATGRCRAHRQARRARAARCVEPARSCRLSTFCVITTTSKSLLERRDREMRGVGLAAQAFARRSL